ncbi:MAG: hypothetical protein QM482_03740 [Sulfurospirillum sp.]
MMNFFELEMGYIVIAIFFLVVTVIVTTRSFMPRIAFKRGMTIVSIILIAFVMLHYYITTKRMHMISNEFNSGKTILCENRGTLKGNQSVIISKKASWTLKDGIFTNPDFYRGFHSARCAVSLR